MWKIPPNDKPLQLLWYTQYEPLRYTEACAQWVKDERRVDLEDCFEAERRRDRLPLLGMITVS